MRILQDYLKNTSTLLEEYLKTTSRLQGLLQNYFILFFLWNIIRHCFSLFTESYCLKLRADSLQSFYRVLAIVDKYLNNLCWAPHIVRYLSTIIIRRRPGPWLVKPVAGQNLLVDLSLHRSCEISPWWLLIYTFWTGCRCPPYQVWWWLGPASPSGWLLSPSSDPYIS